jgi:hypothetical protein
MYWSGLGTSPFNEHNIFLNIKLIKNLKKEFHIVKMTKIQLPYLNGLDLFSQTWWIRS